MKLFIVLCLTAVAVAAPPAFRTVEEKPAVEVIDSHFDKSPDGSYSYRFEQSDGYLKEEKGVALQPGVENSPVEVSGYYKYIDEEGKPVEVHYTANQHGFVPEGAHIQPEITSNARSLVEAKARGLQV